MKELARAPGPGRGAQTDRGVARRNLILRVAAGQFADKGYDHVSINEIGIAAGISGPAIYRYFPGKEDILVSIYQHLYQRADDGVVAIKALDLEPREALKKMIDFQVELATTDPEKIRIVDREHRQLPPDVAKALQKQRTASLAFWIDTASEACPDLSDEAVRVTVHAVLALINSISLRRTSGRVDPAIKQRLRDMALSCFLARPSHS